MNELEARLEKARAMNLVKGTRVGWEEKQRYHLWLAELSAKGYLTSEEYDARVVWLEDAKTDHELKVVLNDLPRMPLSEEYFNTINPQRQQRQTAWQFISRDPKATGFYAVVWLFYMIAGMISGAIPVMIIGASLLTLYASLTLLRIKAADERGNK